MIFQRIAATSVLVLAGVESVSAQDRSASTIQWMHSARSAALQAQQTNLPILAYVASDNCGYCEEMKREAWSHPDIIAMVNRGFVPLELHAQRDAQLVALLQIRAFPTTLIISPDGRQLQRITAYKAPSEFGAILRNVPRAQAAPQRVVSNQVEPDRSTRYSTQAAPQYAASDQQRSPHRIQWEQSVQTAVRRARQSKAPMLVYVSSLNCGYCRKLERDVWNNAAIVSMVESAFVPLKLSAEDNADIVKALGIQGFPTTLVLSSDGQYVARKAGYIPPGQMADLLRGGQQSLLVSQQVRQAQ